MEDEEVIEPTQVIAPDDLSPELRTEKQKRDIDEALRKWHARQDFMARHFRAKDITKGIF
jgi:hypothetical protein